MPEIKLLPELTLAIPVRDWEAARRWYRSTLGLDEIAASAEVGWAEFAGPLPGVSIGLTRTTEPRPGIDGVVITFSVADIQAARAEMEARGIVFDGATHTIEGMVKLATFRDCEGNALMLAQSLVQP